MKKKFSLLFASLFLVMGSAWAQVYQKVMHSEWTVTAPNQSGTNGNEGGVDFIKDENPATFYHSDWGSYYDGHSVKKGQDGLQGFMVDMGSVVYDLSKITYTGRSDDNTSGWARKVRIYLYTELPEGFPANLSTLSYDDKQALFSKENATLGTAAFDNNESQWADDRTLKTAEFSEPKSARYVLFIMDAGHDSWLTCADFHVWQKVEGIVEDQPYFLKISGLDGDYYLDTRDGVNSTYGNTISKTETPIATYFTLRDGYWHISSFPKHEKHFVGVQYWDALVGKDTPVNWYLHKDKEYSLWSLAQSKYHGDTGVEYRYLGANGGAIASQSMIYTDKPIAQAVKFELVALDEKQTAAENARVALDYTGVGYPAADSEARTTLQAAVDAADATAETINAAIEAYKSNAQVQMPEVGKVYRLISAIAGFATKKAIYSDNVEARWQSKDAAAMNQLWAVQSVTNGKIVLMNVSDAMYPQKLAANTLKMLPIEKENDLTFLGDGQFKISNMHANGHGNGSGNSGNIIQYNAGRGSATAWRFEEVAVSEAIKNSLIGAVENTYINSPLIEQEGLEEAVETARANTDHAAALVGLVAAVDAADAQYIDLGYFYMKSKSGQKYAYNNGDDLKAKDDKVKQSIFKLTKADATTFYIQSGNGLYAQISSQSQQTKTAAGQVKFTINKKADGYYVLRAASTDDEMAFWHQDGSSNIVGWRTSASDNSHWTFEELTVEETDKIYSLTALNTPAAGSTVTYNNEAYDGDKEVKQAGGFYVLDEAPVAEDFTVTASGMAEGMTSLVEVNGNSLIAHAGYDGSNIYTLRCKAGNAYARYHSGCQLNADDATNMLTYEGTTYYESLFFVEEGAGDYAGYYTIRSVAAPTMYAYNLKTANEDSKVAMKEAPAEGDLTSAYYWKISKFGGKEAGNITPYGGDAYGWNKRGKYNNMNHIGYWQDHNNTNDNKWYVSLVEEEFIPSLHSVVGHPTNESYEEYLSYAQFINQDGFNKLKNPNWDVVLPEVGKYYRIKNDNGTGYLSSGTGTGRTQFKADIADKESSIFYYDGKLASYENGFYLGESDGFIHYTESNSNASGIDITFKKSPVLGKLLIEFNNNTRSFYSKQAGDSDGASNGQTGEFYRFTIEEVDMSFVREQFDELESIARAYANWMDYGRYTHEDYSDAYELSSKIEEIYLSVNANTTIAELKTKIQLLEDIIDKFNIRKVEAGFYYFVNYDNTTYGEYLSDDRKANDATQRILTIEVTEKNIFYYDGQALMGYASGFGFEHSVCNTMTPGKMNTFTFGEAYEIGKYTVKSAGGTSTDNYAKDFYWKNNNGELERTSNAADASGWDIRPVTSLPVTISSLLHATFYAPVAVKIPSGVTAYTGEVKNADWFTLTEVVDIIPAGTAVVLIAENADTYYFEIVESEAKAITSPHLKGTAPTILNNKEKNYYTLQSHDFDSDNVKEGIAFKQYTGDNLNGFRAYLELPEGTNATALRIRFANEGGTTGVEETIDNSQQSTVIYDLTGRRIEKVVEKGIYIVNGKKVVIK